MSARYFIPDWPLPMGLRAAFSLRTGGVSEGRWSSLNLGLHVGDDLAHVQFNRQRLAQDLALPSEPVWLMQVHGTHVVDAASVSTTDRPPEGDAIVARQGVLAIQVADCLPVLLAAQDGSVYGAAHAGWRGLAGGVLENAVAALAVPPTRLHAWIGPSIRAAQFEVGDEVRDAFGAAHAQAFDRNRRRRWQCDLAGIAAAKLRALGVQSVTDCGLCTAADAQRFFSHRRDAANLGGSGRMAALLWRAAG
jgi:hypothetical protein